MNLLAGYAAPGPGGTGWVVQAGPFTVPLPAVAEPASGHGVEVGIRPEHLGLAGAPDESLAGSSAVEGVVTLVESTGSDTFVHVAAGESRLVARIGQERRPAVGEGVSLRVPPDRWYAFDASTGTTLLTPSGDSGGVPS
jgi:ABC-type sugar transport system ATPase subunit